MNSGKRRTTDYLEAGLPTYLFLGYNIVMVTLSSWLLIFFLVRSVYLPTVQIQIAMAGETAPPPTTVSSTEAITTTMASAESTASASPIAGNTPISALDQNADAQTDVPGNVLSDAGRATLLFTLLTMLAAGCAGGTLCNLRGIFKYYRDEKGLRQAFVVPFYIRPVMGAAVGLFVFFVASFFSDALAGGATDAVTLGWTTLSGRLPFVALAIVAGFGSQEFMERMKEVAKTLFAEFPKETALLQIEATSGWQAGDGAEQYISVGRDEIILVQESQNGQENGKLYYPGESLTKPASTARVLTITGRTIEERVAEAKRILQYTQ